jgi:hypothetical protein
MVFLLETIVNIYPIWIGVKKNHFGQVNFNMSIMSKSSMSLNPKKNQ